MSAQPLQFFFFFFFISVRSRKRVENRLVVSPKEEGKEKQMRDPMRDACVNGYSTFMGFDATQREELRLTSTTFETFLENHPMVDAAIKHDNGAAQRIIRKRSEEWRAWERATNAVFVASSCFQFY